MGHGSNSNISSRAKIRGVVLMDENEKVAVLETLKLAKLAILAMMIIMGYLGQDIILGLV